LVLERKIIFLALLMQGIPQLAQLMTMLEKLYGLFEGDGDAQAHHDDGDMNEEIAPAIDRGVHRVYVEHEIRAASNVAQDISQASSSGEMRRPSEDRRGRHRCKACAFCLNTGHPLREAMKFHSGKSADRDTVSV
jgi:hypothetical protein